ncbi:MAG: S8/S53 family peptidase [Sulfuritalea sp.]|nr:S8/S53 family peptidase [Sulfuritalea sp.]
MPLEAITAEVLILRLRKNDTPAAFQSRIAAIAGPLSGELVSWLDGQWCYLSGGSEELLAGRVAGKSAAQVCIEAGAARVIGIPLAEFELRLGRRANKTGFLRDAGATGVAMPSVIGDSATIDGRSIDLDWQLTISRIDKAWSLFDLSAGAVPWADIRIGHIDTGCTRHPALGFHDGVSDYLRPDLGKNYFSDFLPLPSPDQPDPRPPEEAGPFDNLTGGNGGHGTRTLSTLAGFYERADDDIPPFYGAAPGACVIPYRVTDSILIDAVQRLMVEAIDDAIAQHCRVISMSLGGIIPWSPLARAIDRAYEAGVIVCAAAGNVIRDVTYPGRYNRVITVGGVSPAGPKDFRLWDNASRGEFVDVCGSADGIRRASIERRGGQLVPFITANGSGTSYATALCAGIAAMWLAQRRSELETAYGAPDWRWPAAFKQLIKATAVPGANWDTGNWGSGLYQADALLLAELPPAATLYHEAEAWAPFDPAA